MTVDPCLVSRTESLPWGGEADPACTRVLGLVPDGRNCSTHSQKSQLGGALGTGSWTEPTADGLGNSPTCNIPLEPLKVMLYTWLLLSCLLYGGSWSYPAPISRLPPSSLLLPPVLSHLGGQPLVSTVIFT